LSPAGRPPARRRAVLALRCAAAACSLLAAGTAVSACGGPSAADYGRTACLDVNRSIASYRAALRDTSAPKRRRALAQALIELRAAQAPAAQAGSSDGSWQALMATVTESATIPEGVLIPALEAQCAGVR